MSAAILQVNPEIWVNTPHGEGRALFIIDYGMDHNTVWVVGLNSGIIKHYDSNDVTLVLNAMYNVGHGSR